MILFKPGKKDGYNFHRGFNLTFTFINREYTKDIPLHIEVENQPSYTRFERILWRCFCFKYEEKAVYAIH